MALRTTNDEQFVRFLGVFYGMWTSLDLLIDYWIGKCLDIPTDQTLMVTAGMELGRKVRLLVGLMNRSDHKNKSAIVGALNALQNQSKRNVFAHSYLISHKGGVAFLERSGGDFRIRRHEFSVDEFIDHVKAFTKTGEELGNALGTSPDELQRFVDVAVDLAN